MDEQNSYSYIGQKGVDEQHSGAETAIKKNKMVSVTAVNHLTGGTDDISSEISKLIIDFFMRRPSIEDVAMDGISEGVNNAVLVKQNQTQRRAPYDVGALFVFRGMARWFVAGDAKIYHFEDGELTHSSDPKHTEPLGIDPRFSVRLEDSCRLKGNENAFLVCSGELSKLISDEDLERTLEGSASPEEWMKKIVEIAGEAGKYCANAVFLPKPKKSLFGFRR